jgi:hypothetical protein
LLTDIAELRWRATAAAAAGLLTGETGHSLLALKDNFQPICPAGSGRYDH